MTTTVMDVGGPRANALMAEGLNHFASVSSTHDIFVLGEIVSTQKMGEQLRQECARADYVFVAPGKISLLEIVTELGLWGKTAVLDFRDSSELDISLLGKCRAYFKRSWPIGQSEVTEIHREVDSSRSILARLRRSSGCPGLRLIYHCLVARSMLASISRRRT